LKLLNVEQENKMLADVQNSRKKINEI